MTWLVLLFLSSLCWLVPVSLWFWRWLLLSVVVSFSSSSSSSAAALLLLWILLMGATYNYMCTCIICVCVCVCGGGRGSGPIAATNNWAMLVRTMTPLSCPFLSCIVCSIPMLFRFNHALNGFAKKNTVPPCRQKKNQNGTSKWYIKIHCHPMFIIIVAIKMATHMAQQPPAVLPRCRRPSVTSRVFWIPPCHGHWYRSGNPFDRLLVYNNITKLTGWSGVYGGYI